MKILDIRGDTIVEVLISIAVAGFALGAAYVLANRSFLAGRNAQERSEALKAAQTQIERLRAAQPAGAIFLTSTDYCLDNNLVVRQMHAPRPIVPNNPQTDPFTEYPNQCIINTTGDSDPVNGFYHTSIHYVTSPQPLFTIRVNWNDQRSGRDQLKLYYRVGQ